jgi:hypothetical protein
MCRQANPFARHHLTKIDCDSSTLSRRHPPLPKPHEAKAGEDRGARAQPSTMTSIRPSSFPQALGRLTNALWHYGANQAWKFATIMEPLIDHLEA